MRGEHPRHEDLNYEPNARGDKYGGSHSWMSVMLVPEPPGKPPAGFVSRRRNSEHFFHCPSSFSPILSVRCRSCSESGGTATQTDHPNSVGASTKRLRTYACL